MKKRSIAKKVLCVLALILVLASFFAVNVSAVTSVNTTAPDSDPFIQVIYEKNGTDYPITIWTDGSKYYYIRFLKNTPAYIICHHAVGADGGSLGYSVSTELLFYDEFFNPVNSFVDVWYAVDDGLTYLTDSGGWGTSYSFGSYLPSLACSQFSGTAIYQDSDFTDMIYVVKQYMTNHPSQTDLYTAAQIDNLFKAQQKKNVDSYFGSTSADYEPILGYQWVSSRFYDAMSSEYSSSIASWNDTASQLQARIAELEKLNTDAVKAYDEGKAAAYAEYNAVSGLIDGTVNTISSTIGFFFDNIKVGAVTLGAVVSLVVIFIVVVVIVRKVK